MRGMADIGYGSDICLTFLDSSEIESSVPIPSTYTQGTIKTLRPSSSIGFTIVNHNRQDEPVTLKDSHLCPGVLAAYYEIEKHPSWLWLEGKEKKREHSFSGVSYILSPSGVLIHEAAPCSSRHTIVMYIGVDVVRNFIEESGAEVPLAIRRLLWEPGGEPWLHVLPIDPRVMRVLSQIECNPYNGIIRRVYLEAKGLELIATTLGALINLEKRDESRPMPQTIRRMGEVRDLLDAHYRDGLSLDEVSKAVGISISKLKRDFTRVFGCNVHEYLIEKRLTVVAELMNERYLGLKEAAYAVGYKNPSYLGRLYKERFGSFPHGV